jgi:hypothetical protein
MPGWVNDDPPILFRRFGERSAALAKLGQKLGGSEDWQVGLEPEEVLVAGHEIRAHADGQCREVEGIAGQNRRATVHLISLAERRPRACPSPP